MLCISAQAQQLSNIRAEQRGQDIVLLYSLETNSTCKVSLLLSQDNGVTWSAPLKNVSGDVGENITAGEKHINWKVLEEREQLLGDKIKFKIIANCKKSFEPEMIFVEGGTFKMGSNSGEVHEKPVHTVTLSSYSIGRYEVTQAQWKAIMGSNPSHFNDCNNCPVEGVSWNDIQDFIMKLNAQTSMKYRLPTEAEWEYAAKGGKNKKGFSFSGSIDINSVAWYSDNSNGKTHSVGIKQANKLGIYDMTGNVWEWCSDWYGNYSRNNETNPIGVSSGQDRVLRGGGWICNSTICHISARIRLNPDCRGNGSGFRLVLPADR